MVMSEEEKGKEGEKRRDEMNKLSAEEVREPGEHDFDIPAENIEGILGPQGVIEIGDEDHTKKPELLTDIDDQKRERIIESSND